MKICDLKIGHMYCTLNKDILIHSYNEFWSVDTLHKTFPFFIIEINENNPHNLLVKVLNFKVLTNKLIGYIFPNEFIDHKFQLLK